MHNNSYKLLVYNTMVLKKKFIFKAFGGTGTRTQHAHDSVKHHKKILEKSLSMCFRNSCYIYVGTQNMYTL